MRTANKLLNVKQVKTASGTKVYEVFRNNWPVGLVRFNFKKRMYEFNPNEDRSLQLDEQVELHKFMCNLQRGFIAKVEKLGTDDVHRVENQDFLTMPENDFDTGRIIPILS